MTVAPVVAPVVTVSENCLQTTGNDISDAREDVFLLDGSRPSLAIQQTGKVGLLEKVCAGPVDSDGKGPAETHNREPINPHGDPGTEKGRIVHS